MSSIVRRPVTFRVVFPVAGERMEKGSLFKNMLRSKLLWAAVIVFAVALLFVALAPYLIKLGIERALTRAGNEHSEVREVDFDLFSRTLVVHGLRARPKGTKGLEVSEVTMQFSLWPLFRKRLMIDKIDIEGADITVERSKDGGIVIGGLMPGPAADRASPEKRPPSWLVNINDINAGNTLIHYVTDKADMTITAGGLTISGPVTFDHHSSKESTQAFSHEGTAIVEKLDVRSRAFEAFEESISWKGSILATSKGDDRPPEITVRGRIEGSGPVMSLPERGLRLEHDGLVADVLRKKGFASGKDSLFEKATVSGLKIDSPERGINLLDVDTLELKGVGYEKGRLAIGSMQLKGVSAVRSVADAPEAGTGEEGSLFSASAVVVSDVEVTEPVKVATGPVELSGAKVLLRFMPDGDLYMVKEFTEALSRGDRPGGSKPDLAIASIGLSEGSSIRFEDERVTPPYRTTLRIDRAGIENVESARPEQPSAVTLEGTVDEYTRVVASGNIQPFADRLTLHLTGRLEAFDLPPLTPYSTRHLGFTLDSGHMNSDIEVNIVEGKIEGSGKLELSKLKLSPGQEEGLKKLTAELTMPLDTALSLIRDKEDKIHLTLSLQGDIKDPTLNLGNIINQALGKAVKKASISYLKYLFQPYGTYITVIQLAGGLATEAVRVRLDPVFFEPGSVALEATVPHYLERVAGLMTDRPGIEMKLCGKAVASDLTVMKKRADTEERLQALARERASVIKEHLVDQHGITAERLFICNPEVDSQEDASPRVELLL